MLKTVKKLGVCLLVLTLILCLASCGGGKAKDVDINALAKDLTASAAFTEDMSQHPVAESVAAGLYRYDPSQVESCVLYANTSTGEEIFLAKAASADAAKSVSALCQQRVSDQKAVLESYVPEAIPRLDSAIVTVSGQTVIFVVANDAAAAQSVVDGYLK